MFMVIVSLTVARIHHAGLFTRQTRADRKIAWSAQKIGSNAPTRPLGYVLEERKPLEFPEDGNLPRPE